MKRTLTVLAGSAALALPLSLAAATPAAAAPTPGAQCAQNGIAFLRDNGLLKAAASQQVDYGALNEAGVIAVPGLSSPATLPLGQVVKLHISNPEYFPAWC